MLFGVIEASQINQNLINLFFHVQLQFLILFLFTSSATPTPASDADVTTLRGQFSSMSCQG